MQTRRVFYHSRHSLSNTTGQCYWAVIIWIFGVIGLAMGMMVASLQEGGKTPVSQILLKTLKRHWREASGRCFKIW